MLVASSPAASLPGAVAHVGEAECNQSTAALLCRWEGHFKLAHTNLALWDLLASVDRRRQRSHGSNGNRVCLIQVLRPPVALQVTAQLGCNNAGCGGWGGWRTSILSFKYYFLNNSCASGCHIPHCHLMKGIFPGLKPLAGGHWGLNPRL